MRRTVSAGKPRCWATRLTGATSQASAIAASSRVV
jgi:hypothetical protein